MKSLEKPFKVLLVLTSAILTACATNVQWKEEVLLNTGETIWVTKEVRYSIKGQAGNPLDMRYSPDFMEITSFKYDGREYIYKSNAGLIVLAISPKKIPVLLTSPGDNNWHRHNNYPLCTKPYYVQFVPDSTGQIWEWKNNIDLWTYNLSANLMIHRDHPFKAKKQYTMADKAQQNYLKDPRSLYLKKIDPLYTNENCHQE
jgi:hypothetical protein